MSYKMTQNADGTWALVNKVTGNAVISIDSNDVISFVSAGLIGFSRGALAATGSGASTAAVITKQITAVTASDGTKAVALPAAATTTGPLLVINTVTSAALPVYPVNGGNDNINAGAEDAAFTLGPGKAAWFIPTSATQWYVEDESAVTATTTEMNVLAGVTAGTGAASKAAVLSASGNLTMPSGSGLRMSRATLAAAGSTAADAGAIQHQFSIATGADGVKGIVLPAASSTEGPYWVYNDAAASLLVWPVNAGNDLINGMSANTAYTVAGGELVVFIGTSSTQWYAATAPAQGKPTPKTRSTVTNAATISAAQLRGGILYQDASGGNVTMTTRTGTQIAGDMPEMRTGDAITLYLASNHGSNTSTIAGGTDVTLVGSGAVINTGGVFQLVKTAATTFDLVRVG